MCCRSTDEAIDKMLRENTGGKLITRQYCARPANATTPAKVRLRLPNLVFIVGVVRLASIVIAGLAYRFIEGLAH